MDGMEREEVRPWYEIEELKTTGRQMLFWFSVGVTIILILRLIVRL